MNAASVSFHEMSSMAVTATDLWGEGLGRGWMPPVDIYENDDRELVLKAELPDLHIHGFSPEEVLYGAVRSKCSIEEYLVGLKQAGVGSLPGTSAEILDQEVRDRIAPGRINVEQWTEVITSAHKVGIPTTSTRRSKCCRNSTRGPMRTMAISTSAPHWR